MNSYLMQKMLLESLGLIEASLQLVVSRKPFALKDLRRCLHTIKANASYFNLHEVMKSSDDLELFLEPLDHSQWGDTNMGMVVEKKLEDFMRVLGNFCPTPTSKLHTAIQLENIQTHFETYPEQVRELGMGLHKKVQFKLEGAELVLPEGNWSELFGTFIHFIRNSVDHGIESVAARLASGKNPVGEICFSFCLKDEGLEIILSDDGSGLDWKKLARKDSYIQNDSDAIKRIIEGGVSGLESASEISGRGLGFSAITSVADKWGARISVLSTPGKGLMLILQVPLKNSQPLQEIA